ncbi:hypothetical protein BDP81DRAFT_130839 [Colletotrichum phormii]|uniref:Secreted protein n=1 Tax=Colletotrichum phormii TaxID=359342 RepID=A0AAJ0EJR5_9PEZI|nr:uncharacterized protein BDP81DRAFT_130839 [Colletotrichum phormii]KAK1641289.1 hypothetical protein BDP81DRAFT_130839 [Colletotrichum phormii]
MNSSHSPFFFFFFFFFFFGDSGHPIDGHATHFAYHSPILSRHSPESPNETLPFVREAGLAVAPSQDNVKKTMSSVRHLSIRTEKRHIESE